MAEHAWVSLAVILLQTVFLIGLVLLCFLEVLLRLLLQTQELSSATSSNNCLQEDLVVGQNVMHHLLVVGSPPDQLDLCLHCCQFHETQIYLT